MANSLDLSVIKLDPATGRITALFRVGDAPNAIAVAKDGVWVSDEFDATLAHIDPGTGQVRKIVVGSSPRGLALTSARVWVAARPFTAASHRGGTLTVVTQWLPARDPVLAWGTQDTPALATAYDGLVALRRSDVRYPTRVHSSPKDGTTYVFLNTRQPPFTNAQVRRAVNYAIDRAHMVQLLDLALGQAAVTCQIIPADFPGHQPYCPYTAGRKNGSWHGPQMRKAVQLVKASHTTSTPVTVWSYLGDAGEGAYLVQLLENLGYRATLHAVSADEYYGAISNSHRKIQIGLGDFGADFPSPSTFILPALTCRSFGQNPTGTANYAGYCNPGVDKLTARAQAAQLTDPAAARAVWARVDRVATDQAPWAPVFNNSWTVFVSARVGNSQVHPTYGPLLDQMWVR